MVHPPLLRVRWACVSHRAVWAALVFAVCPVLAQSPEMWHGHRRAAEARPISKIDTFEQVVPAPENLVNAPESRVSEPPAPPPPGVAQTASGQSLEQSWQAVLQSVQRVQAILRVHQQLTQCATEVERPAPTTARDEVDAPISQATAAPATPSPMVMVPVSSPLGWEQVAAIAVAVLLAPLPVVWLLLVLIRQQMLPFQVTVVNGLPSSNSDTVQSETAGGLTSETEAALWEIREEKLRYQEDQTQS